MSPALWGVFSNWPSPYSLVKNRVRAWSSQKLRKTNASKPRLSARYEYRHHVGHRLWVMSGQPEQNLRLPKKRCMVTGCMTAARKQQPMTVTQASALKRLTQDAYEPDAFKPNLTSAEADIRIAMLTAKLKLLGEPPHTL